MMISLFIILLLIAVLLFIKGADDDAIAYYGISLVMFLLLTGLSFYITIPMADPATSTIVEHRYIEYGLVAICPMFCFIDIIMMIMHMMHGRRMKKGEIPYVPPGLQ